MLWAGPFFKLNLLGIIKQTPYIVISFDESHNNVIKRVQMDVLVCFWDSYVNKVSTQYVNSEFLGKSSAGDVFQKFEIAAFKICLSSRQMLRLLLRHICFLVSALAKQMSRQLNS